MSRRRVLVIHGPGLDLTRAGLRAPAPDSVEESDRRCRQWAAALDLDVDIAAAVGESALVAAVEARHADGLIVTPGPLAFTSAALGQAVARAGIPVVDLHVADLYREGREPAASLLARAGARTIHGRGTDAHRDALAHLAWRLEWPATTHAYGPAADHVGDLRVPQGAGPHPVVVLLHGGFWLRPWERDLMDGLGVDLARRGAATWNVEYRRTGGGGGWPATADDVCRAVEHLAALAAEHPLDLRRVILLGHSAGGHLALVAAARAGLAPAEGARAEVDRAGGDSVGDARAGDARAGVVRPARVVALAGLTDLAAAARQGLGGGAVDGFLDGADPAQASPIEMLPLGVPQVLAHSAADAVVPPAQSRAHARRAARLGDIVDYRECAGDHFDLIDPASPGWGSVADAVLAH